MYKFNVLFFNFAFFSKKSKRTYSVIKNVHQKKLNFLKNKKINFIFFKNYHYTITYFNLIKNFNNFNKLYQNFFFFFYIFEKQLFLPDFKIKNKKILNEIMINLKYLMYNLHVNYYKILILNIFNKLFF